MQVVYVDVNLETTKLYCLLNIKYTHQLCELLSYYTSLLILK